MGTWLSASPLLADDPVIVRVEEDWELSVGEPTGEDNAPQVSTVMTPHPGIDGTHFIFLVNYRTEPSYQAGGMEIQQWYGDNVVAHTSKLNTQLSQSGESVRWTQSIELTGGNLVYRIKDGIGDTWGTFGNGTLVSGVATELTNLATYSPVVSIQESGISYAGNRVSSLTLRQIRWIASDGRVYSVSAPIDLDSDLDPWE
jgi:hypothetical protein